MFQMQLTICLLLGLLFGCKEQAVTVNVDPNGRNGFELLSIHRVTPLDAITNSQTLTFKLTFSEELAQSPDLIHFQLQTTGTAAGVLDEVNGSAKEFTVKIRDVSGDGTLALILKEEAKNILNLKNKSLSSLEAKSIQTYTIDNSLPVVQILTPASNAIFNSISSSSLSVTGNCNEAGSIALTFGDGVNEVRKDLICSADTSLLWSSTVDINSLNDGPVTLTAVLTDQVGNDSAPVNQNISKDTTAPILSVASPLATGFIKTTNHTAIVFSGSCSENGRNVGLTVSDGSTSLTDTLTCNTSATPNWTRTFDLTSLNDGSISFLATQTDVAGNSGSTPALSKVKDTTPPQIIPASFQINSGATTTYNSFINSGFQAVDATSNITQFCLKMSPPDPVASDACWRMVDSPSPGLTPAQTINVTNYNYHLGFLAGTKTLYLWVKDESDNVTALSSAGTGIDGLDRVSITYSPGSPPGLINVTATRTDSPNSPMTSTDVNIAQNQDVYIKWKAASSTAGLSATPIQLYYTIDDINFIPIPDPATPTNISNSANGGCNTDVNTTGCYRWVAQAPRNEYFKIRVKVIDDAGQITSTDSNSVNSWPPLSMIAGNTTDGLDSSASSALFFNDNNLVHGSYGIPGRMAFAENGTFYYLDVKRGILKIDPNDGVVRLLIPTTGVMTGEDVDVSMATLRYPVKISIRKNDELIIFDYDRIRRVDPVTNRISTFIGGGAQTGDNVDPLDVTIISNHNSLGNLNVGPPMIFIGLPNGDVYFQSENHNVYSVGKKIRIYDETDGKVRSLEFGGTGTSTLPGVDIATNVISSFGLAFNPNTWALEHIHGVFHKTTAPNDKNGTVNFNPVTGLSEAPHPGSIQSINTNEGDRFYAYKHTGRDGNLYALSNIGQRGLFRFDRQTLNWVQILGIPDNATQGYCVDGTEADECLNHVYDMWVTSNGRVYFDDAGVIRTIDENGHVRTVFGQSHSYGHNINALQARFKLPDEAYYVDNDKVIVRDGAYIKEITIGGNINIIAGNGTLANTAVLDVDATTTFIQSSKGHMTVNKTNGDIFYMHRYTRIGRLDRSQTPAVWKEVASFSGHGPQALSFDPVNNLLYYWSQQLTNGSYHTSVFNTYEPYHDTPSSTQTLAVGTPAVFPGTTWSANGAAVGNTLQIPTWPLNNGVYMKSFIDTYSNPDQLLVTISNRNEIVFLPFGGAKTTRATTEAPLSFTYVHSATKNALYYCGATSNKIRKIDLDGTPVTDVALPWPIDSIKCEGQSLDYSPGRNTLLFPYSQNGAFGLVEYQNP